MWKLMNFPLGPPSPQPHTMHTHAVQPGYNHPPRPRKAQVNLRGSAATPQATWKCKVNMVCARKVRTRLGPAGGEGELYIELRNETWRCSMEIRWILRSILIETPRAKIISSISMLLFKVNLRQKQIIIKNMFPSLLLLPHPKVAKTGMIWLIKKASFNYFINFY